MGGALRLFFALPLPADLCGALGRWQRAQPVIGGWSRPEGLHLTLAFLGARAPEGLAQLEAIGEAVAAGHRAFELRTAALGAFPDPGRARVLWLGLAPSPDLERLSADLREALATAGKAFDPKPFRPHLTLARFRRTSPVDMLLPPAPAGFTAAALVLFESQPQGCYRPVRTWNLDRA